MYGGVCTGVCVCVCQRAAMVVSTCSLLNRVSLNLELTNLARLAGIVDSSNDSHAVIPITGWPVPQKYLLVPVTLEDGVWVRISALPWVALQTWATIAVLWNLIFRIQLSIYLITANISVSHLWEAESWKGRPGSTDSGYCYTWGTEYAWQSFQDQAAAAQPKWGAGAPRGPLILSEDTDAWGEAVTGGDEL